MWASIVAFTLVAALLTITPGVDMALVFRNTLAGGRSVGLRTSAGICSGLIAWGLLSALGVSALVSASRAAYDVLRFATGMLNNMLNPKIGVFYATLLPQFIPAGASVLGVSVLLAAIHAVEGMLWLSLLTLAVSRAGSVMRRPAVRRGLERLTGVVLIGFGARVALEHV